MFVAAAASSGEATFAGLREEDCMSRLAEDRTFHLAVAFAGTVDIVAASAVALGATRFDTAVAFVAAPSSSDTGSAVVVLMAVDPSPAVAVTMVAVDIADIVAAFASVAPASFVDISDTAGIAPRSCHSRGASCPAAGMFAYSFRICAFVRP